MHIVLLLLLMGVNLACAFRVHRYTRGDTTVYSDGQHWQCDQITCPEGTEECYALKQPFPDRKISVRRNICFDDSGHILNEITSEAPYTKIDTLAEMHVTDKGQRMWINYFISRPSLIRNINESHKQFNHDKSDEFFDIGKESSFGSTPARNRGIKFQFVSNGFMLNILTMFLISKILFCNSMEFERNM